MFLLKLYLKCVVSDIHLQDIKPAFTIYSYIFISIYLV